MTALLEVDNIRAGFGSNTVLHGLSFTVEEGEIAGVFGLNGAGKSVSMKVLAGVVPAWSGRVVFAGEDITRLRPEDRVARGMGHVPQGRQVFPALSIEENLRLGAYTLRRKDKSRWPAAVAGVYDRFPVLGERRHQLAGTLSGGEQAAVAVGRALVNEPKLILVDEPSAGLAPLIVRQLFETLKIVATSGVTMVLVEQNVAFGLQLADRANILQVGRVVHSGPVASLDQGTLARYLGIGQMLGTSTGAALTSRQDAAAPRTARREQRRARRSGVAKADDG